MVLLFFFLSFEEMQPTKQQKPGPPKRPIATEKFAHKILLPTIQEANNKTTMTTQILAQKILATIQNPEKYSTKDFRQLYNLARANQKVWVHLRTQSNQFKAIWPWWKRAETDETHKLRFLNVVSYCTQSKQAAKIMAQQRKGKQVWEIVASFFKLDFL